MPKFLAYADYALGKRLAKHILPLKVQGEGVPSHVTMIFLHVDPGT
jgi:hypothetical protein